MKHCIACNRSVQPVRRFNWGAMFITFGFYLLWYPLTSKRCPICGGSRWDSTK